MSAATRRRLGLVTLLASLVVPLTYGAVRAFPVYDDAWLWLYLHEAPLNLVHGDMADRPVAAFVWEALARAGALMPVSVALYFVTWLATGLVTAALWRRAFPALAAFAPAAAALAVAPVLVETQMLLINPIYTAQVGVVLAYAALLMATARWRSRESLFGARLVGVTLVAAGAMLSEYGVLATIAGTLALSLLVRADGERAGGRTRSLGVLAGTAVLCYFLHHRVASSAARLLVRPEYQASRLTMRGALEAPVKLLMSVYTGSIGELLADFGELTTLNRSAYRGLLYSVVPLAIWWIAFRRRDAAEDDASTSAAIPLARVATLLAAAVFVLATVVLLYSAPETNFSTRLWLPMLPLMACVMLALLLAIVRERLRVAAAAACIVLAGQLTSNAASWGIGARRTTVALGDLIRPHLAPTGLTVAMVSGLPTNPFVGEVDQPDHYELTARLSWNWSDDERRRFVAFSPGSEWHRASLGKETAQLDQVDLKIRGWTRSGPVARWIWVYRNNAGTFVYPVDARGDQSRRP